MDKSARRLLIAIIAWPAGILFTIGWTILGVESSPCGPNGMCGSITRTVSTTDMVEFLTFALGPGIVATWFWWRNRPRP